MLARGEPVQLFAHCDVPLVWRHHETGVRELTDLLGDVGHDALGRVADARHSDTRAEVDQRVAVDIDENTTAGLRDEDGQHHTHAAGDSPGAPGEQLTR